MEPSVILRSNEGLKSVGEFCFGYLVIDVSLHFTPNFSPYSIANQLRRLLIHGVALVNWLVLV